MDDSDRPSLDPTIGHAIVAFGSSQSCSLESRAAVSVAVDVLRDCLKEDLNDIMSGRKPMNTDAYLPPTWRIGVDEAFMVGMTNAMRSVERGLHDAGWEGPANTAEELCLKAIFDHASDVVPEIYKVEDENQVRDDLMDLRELGFQDIDHQFLFEPEMDGIDKSDLGAHLGMQSLSRRDAFKRFSNR